MFYRGFEFFKIHRLDEVFGDLVESSAGEIRPAVEGKRDAWKSPDCISTLYREANLTGVAAGRVAAI